MCQRFLKIGSAACSNKIPSLVRTLGTHRAAVATSWRILNHDGKISPCLVRVGGERPPPFSSTQLWYTLQLSRYTLPISTLLCDVFRVSKKIMMTLHEKPKDFCVFEFLCTLYILFIY
jgi:hypothetical protein